MNHHHHRRIASRGTQDARMCVEIWIESRRNRLRRISRLLVGRRRVGSCGWFYAADGCVTWVELRDTHGTEDGKLQPEWRNWKISPRATSLSISNVVGGVCLYVQVQSTKRFAQQKSSCRSWWSVVRLAWHGTPTSPVTIQGGSRHDNYPSD